jgi:hypothetical protein
MGNGGGLFHPNATLQILRWALEDAVRSSAVLDEL